MVSYKIKEPFLYSIFLPKHFLLRQNSPYRTYVRAVNLTGRPFKISVKILSKNFKAKRTKRRGPLNSVPKNGLKTVSPKQDREEIERKKKEEEKLWMKILKEDLYKSRCIYTDGLNRQNLIEILTVNSYRSKCPQFLTLKQGFISCYPVLFY